MLTWRRVAECKQLRLCFHQPHLFLSATASLFSTFQLTLHTHRLFEMSLQVRYQSFLAKPNLSLLTAEASLNYITTLTTVNSNIGIVKHLASQEKALKKEEEKVIGSIEGDSAICLDIETTLEFLRGGGAYLPGLDENFLSDRTVTFPVVGLFEPRWRYLLISHKGSHCPF